MMDFKKFIERAVCWKFSIVHSFHLFIFFLKFFIVLFFFCCHRLTFFSFKCLWINVFMAILKQTSSFRYVFAINVRFFSQQTVWACHATESFILSPYALLFDFVLLIFATLFFSLFQINFMTINSIVIDFVFFFVSFSIVWFS